jgi:hypothetical protein
VENDLGGASHSPAQRASGERLLTKVDKRSMMIGQLWKGEERRRGAILAASRARAKDIAGVVASPATVRSN